MFTLRNRRVLRVPIDGAGSFDKGAACSPMNWERRNIPVLLHQILTMLEVRKGSEGQPVEALDCENHVEVHTLSAQYCQLDGCILSLCRAGGISQGSPGSVMCLASHSSDLLRHTRLFVKLKHLMVIEHGTHAKRGRSEPRTT